MRLVLIGLIAVATVTLGLFLALDFMPPRQIAMAAGQPGSAYFALASEYRRILARDGIAVAIIETPGSVANSAALEDGADVAIVQGGVPLPETAEPLASILLEPLFVIYRVGFDATDPAAWGRLRISAGAEGSGTRAAVRSVLAALGDPLPDERLLALNVLDASAALIEERIDAAIFVAPIGAPYLNDLLRDPRFAIARLRDLPAVAARLDFVDLVEIPAAGIDYLRRLPPEPVQLPAMVGRLVAREGLHPAVVDRLIMAAKQIHRPADLVTREGRFPSADGLGNSINPQAEGLLRDGPGPLAGLLPYWAVAQINRFALLLLPVLFLLVPMIRAVPAIYAWGMERRIWRHYESVLKIDAAGETAAEAAEVEALLAQLDKVDAAARDIRVAPRFRASAYGLRMHIDLVRRRLLARQRGEAAPEV